MNLEKLGRLRAACEFMLEWTPRCEMMDPEWVLRIEDQEQDWPEVARRLGVDPAHQPDFVHMNAKTPKQLLTYEDISREVSSEVADRISKMYAKYGY